MPLRLPAGKRITFAFLSSLRLAPVFGLQHHSILFLYPSGNNLMQYNSNPLRDLRSLQQHHREVHFRALRLGHLLHDQNPNLNRIQNR